MDLRTQIFAIQDIQSEVIYIPEWSMPVTVTALTGTERDLFETKVEVARKTGTLRALLATLVCQDADGKKIFEEHDAPQLAGKCAAALDRIWDVGARLAGISKKDSEELEGN